MKIRNLTPRLTTLILGQALLVAQPANDACSSAETLTVTQTCSYTMGSVKTATRSSETPNPTCSSFGSFASDDRDVWYKVVVPSQSSGAVDIKIESELDVVAAQVYSGTCALLTTLSCATNYSTSPATINITGRTAG